MGEGVHRGAVQGDGNNSRNEPVGVLSTDLNTPGGQRWRLIMDQYRVIKRPLARQA